MATDQDRARCDAWIKEQGFWCVGTEAYVAWRAWQAALASQVEPDPALLHFYRATDFPSLVSALEDHVMKLIDTCARNVKPWEDTFPPTLLPKWIREKSPVLAEDLLALAESWQNEAAESWGESPAHAAKQECCHELRALIDGKALDLGYAAILVDNRRDRNA